MIRNYKIREFTWIGENQFTCIWSHPWYPDGVAGYGWSKGGSFFVYTIKEGHISKLGTVKRMQIEVDFPPQSW